MEKVLQAIIIREKEKVSKESTLLVSIATS